MQNYVRRVSNFDENFSKWPVETSLSTQMEAKQMLNI